MHIEINDNTTIREIQDTFSDYFPNLQIRFYDTPHKKYEASAEEDQVYTARTIGDIKKTHISALLEIQPRYKVAQVEREFMDRFGLSVQVLSKNGDNWVQTTGTDDFTLKELNEIAMSSSDEYILSDPEEENIKEQFT
jgi:hypothetical protein